MKRIFFILLFVYTAPSLQAQPLNFKWARQMGGVASGWGGWGNSIAVDDYGNVYTTGVFTTGTIDVDPGPGVVSLSTTDGEAMFVCKVNVAGDLVWARQVDGNKNNLTMGHSITVDAHGNVYVTGNFHGNGVDFNPGAGVFNLSAETEDMFILKLDASGNFVWAKQIGGSVNEHVVGYSIVLDGQGNIYAVGNYYGMHIDFDPGPAVLILDTTLGTQKIFVSKLDGNGNLLWAKKMDAISDGNGIWGSYGLSCAVDGAGNIYTTGYFGGTVDFDPGPGVFFLSTIYGDSFISKLDVNGNFVWAKKAEQTSESFVSGNSIAVDASGNVYATGFFQGVVDFDPGPGVFNLTGSNDPLEFTIYVSRLNTDGDFMWAKQIGGLGHSTFVTDFPPQFSSIALDIGGNVYTTGPFSGIVDFDPGVSAFNLSSTGIQDAFVTKMDAAGNFVWAQQMGATGSAYCSSITADVTGNIYTTGAFSGTIDFDPGPDAYNLTSIGAIDHFIHKMGPCINKTTSTITELTCKSYTWNGQVYTTSGVYTQTFLSKAGCDSIVTLELVVKPQSFSAFNQTICEGQNYLGYTSTGTYSDTLIAVNGCDSIRTLQLTVLPLPAPNLGADKELCPGDSLVLYPGQFDSYLWQDGSTQNQFNVRQPGLYSLLATNNCGSVSDEILVKERICDVQFPSAFTPNNDGKNDLFKALGAYNLNSYHLIIYNRLGQKVFETNDYTKGWDGKLKGQLQQTGVYVWYCRFIKPNTSGNREMKGTVMLIR